MEKYLFTVESNCIDDAREVAFLEWYDEIDLPDVLETEGFVKATRFVCDADLDQRYNRVDASAVKGKILALYEIETNDIDAVLKALDEGVARMRARGRDTDLIKVVARRLYSEAKSLRK